MAAIRVRYPIPHRFIPHNLPPLLRSATNVVLQRRTALLATLLAAGFVAAGVGPWTEVIRDFFGKQDPFWVREDFTAFYSGAALVREGLASHLYDPAAITIAERAAAGRQVGGSGALYYFNPPFFAWLMAPLTHLSLQHAYQLWTIGSIGLLAVNCWLLDRLARGLPRTARTLLLLGYLTLYPLTFGLRLGQFSLILQASWAGGALLLARRKDGWAGLAFAPLLIKPELALPVVLFLAIKRAWGTLAVFAVAAAGAGLFSIALIGVPAALHYPGYVLSSTAANGNGVAPDLMIDWSGLLAATFGHGASLGRPLAAGLLSLATLVALVPFIRRLSGRGSFWWAAQWLAVSLAALLCDPHLYLQDTVIAVPAAVAVLATAPENWRGAIGGVLLTGWSVERLALHPNQVWHVDIFALYLAELFILTVVGAHVLWPKADARRSPAVRRASDAAVALPEFAGSSGGS